MIVSQAMSREVETVTADTNLVTAARLMRKDGIGFLPVVEEGFLVGVVTDRDIVLRGVSEGLNPYIGRIGDIMTRTAVWCYQDEVLTTAVQIMEDSRIRRLLVLDSNKRLVGLLSLDDVAAKMSSDRLLGTVLRHVTSAA